jgi:hypothetical protein
LYSYYLIRAPKNAGKFAGDFAEVAFWVLKTRCPEGGNLNVEQVNMHLNNIALKHAAHDPSKTFLFSPKENTNSFWLNIWLLIVRVTVKLGVLNFVWGKAMDGNRTEHTAHPHLSYFPMNCESSP